MEEIVPTRTLVGYNAAGLPLTDPTRQSGKPSRALQFMLLAYSLRL
jgi:hypothetical protein